MALLPCVELAQLAQSWKANLYPSCSLSGQEVWLELCTMPFRKCRHATLLSSFPASACSYPAISATHPLSDTSGSVDIKAPVSTNCTSYQLKLCPTNAAPSACFNPSLCPDTTCVVIGLTPLTSYNVTAVCITAKGLRSKESNAMLLTTLPPPPTLTTAQARGPFTGEATASPPSGVGFQQVSRRAVEFAYGHACTTMSHSGPLM